MGQTIQLPNGLPSCIRPGEILAGKYRLEREVGRGAMGTVWSAMHLTLGQRVAIKLISSEHAQSPEARARFSTEAKAAARLRSRHVVQVYDDGETPEGTPFLVMEYLEGESLESRIEREGAIPLVDAVRITAQVARALARAHAHGIVHRDLKPGNIFLTRSDEDELGWLAKVLDFGIAKVEEHREQSTTKTGTVLGTPLFMSPEQVRGASTVDHRADLYSLGMCFFNMLTGRFAFDGESFGAILVAICTDPLPDIRVYTPWVSEAVARWFQRCCARAASDRYQSADELIEALQAAVGTTIQTLHRRAATDEQVGPSGTLKGHSAPLSPNTRALGADESGAFGAPHARTTTDPTVRTQPGASSQSSAVLTVPGIEARSSGRKRALLAAAAVAVLAAGIGYSVSRKRAPELDAEVAARAAAPAAEAASAPAKGAPGMPAKEATAGPAPNPPPSARASVAAPSTEPPAQPVAKATPPIDATKPAPAPALEAAPVPPAIRPRSPQAPARPAADAAAAKPTSKPIDIGF